ncbi:RHS repeat-associated core domain-containing protein [Sphingorhabdus sp.]|uniref:RHS repeat-associated core domain-containing protein n=1 Tax=Sphingorhabdus sp. TaxID=1902408 RepID=UPI0037C558BB
MGMTNADERGSIIAVSNGTGNALAINRYDDWGIPDPGNIGRFQFTGHAWLPEAGLYYARARIYSPTLGRFLQTDPIGYGDGMNLYNYVGSDPINGVDPTGLAVEDVSTIVVEALRKQPNNSSANLWYNVGYVVGKFLKSINPFKKSKAKAKAKPKAEEPAKQQQSKQCPVVVPANIPNYLYVPMDLARTAGSWHKAANDAAKARFPNLRGVDDSRDAYRHTWAAIALSREYGPARTLGAGNVNELQGFVRGLVGQSGYTAAARAMDDHNNYAGAALGADSRYANMSTTELADFAFARGCVVKAP